MPRCNHASAECIVHPNFWVCKHVGCANGPTISDMPMFKADVGTVEPTWTTVFARWASPAMSSYSRGCYVGSLVRLELPADVTDDYRWGKQWVFSPNGISLQPTNGPFYRVIALDHSKLASEAEIEWDDMLGWLPVGGSNGSP